MPAENRRSPLISTVYRPGAVASTSGTATRRPLTSTSSSVAGAPQGSENDTLSRPPNEGFGIRSRAKATGAASPTAVVWFGPSAANGLSFPFRSTADSVERLAVELSDPANLTYLALQGEMPVGFLTLRPGATTPAVTGPGPVSQHPEPPEAP